MTIPTSHPPRPLSSSSSGPATVRAMAFSSSPDRPTITLKKRRKKPDKPAPDELIDRLHRTYPAAFTLPPRPLAIGIRADILASGAWTLTQKQARRALYYWAQQPEYQAALVPGAPRYALDGSQCGEVE